MNDSEQLLTQLIEFERLIHFSVMLFTERFGVPNPCPLWRRGEIDRVGIIGDGFEYSFHGRGCTIEFQGRIVSFDFDQSEQAVYSPFKFLTFLDDDALSLSEIESFFTELNNEGKLTAIEGRGVRLAATTKD